MESLFIQSHSLCAGYDLSSLLLPNDKNLGSYPIIYSYKRYNAEEFLLYLFGSLMQAPVRNADLMSSIKLLLCKSLYWQYEQEWRVIKSDASNLFDGHSEPISLKPNSIYHGCRISREDYQKLHEVALRKGIE